MKEFLPGEWESFKWGWVWWNEWVSNESEFNELHGSASEYACKKQVSDFKGLSRWGNKNDCDRMRGQASEAQIGGISEWASESVYGELVSKQVRKS